MASDSALVIGLGEVGKPLAEIVETRFRTLKKDVEPLDISEKIRVVHICYPYQVGDFVGVTSHYARQYKPNLLIIHNTVIPGTTRAIGERTGVPTAYSPVRGKHTRMKQDMLTYTKFLSGVTEEATAAAEDHLRAVGMHTQRFSTPEALELAKLLETTYFGMLLAWTQEMERYTRSISSNYYEIMQFMKEISYLPPVVFQPGFIGGHCIIPNSHLLDEVRPSPFTQLLRQSNEIKAQEWLDAGKSLDERLTPQENK